MNADYISIMVQQLKQSGQLEAILEHPSVREVLQNQKPAEKKYVISDLSEDEAIFMKAYRAFLSDKVGNKYVGMASNFARYLQSLVDKDKAGQQDQASPAKDEVVTN
jgi:hypothetical protein